MRIYSVTPNPALDLSGHVDKIVANEKNYVTRTRLDPGGNGINAARIAKRLGAKPVLFGFAGGAAGSQVETLLEQEDMQTSFTEIKGTTRTNVKVTNDRDQEQTRLTFPGPKVSRGEVEQLKRAIARARAPGIIILGGSVPKGCPPHFNFSLIQIAQKQGLGIIIDVPAQEMKLTLKKCAQKLLLIKPNQTELEGILEKKLRSDSSIADAAQKLTQKSAIVCVSLAERGAIFAVEGKRWFARAPKVKTKGTVGAGDSMVGAMATRLTYWKLTSPSAIHAFAEDKILDVFCWGVAGGAATAATEGTTLGHPALIRELRKRVVVKPL
jgi:1-phosphofructokinase family hexose kinase